MSVRNQRGVALITAVLVTALATIAAAAVLGHANGALRRSANLFESEAAWWYADGMDAWGITILQRDAKQNKIDALSDAWAQPIEALPVDQGLVRGEIVDLQGRFNVNHLGLPNAQDYIDQFRRLTACLEIDASGVGDLANAIGDWVDADDNQRFPGGAEDLNYLNLEVAYRAANQPITSISELAAVSGMTREIYAALRPHITALPLDNGPMTINVNTASEAVLCSLAPNGPGPGLQAFLETRLEEPYDNAQQAVADNLFGTGFDPQLIGVSSQYFEINAEAFIGTGRVALYSVVARGNGATPTIIDRRVDTD